MALRIEQTQKQTTVVTQQLIQSVEILQMTSQDLAELIYNEAVDNPVIDMDELNISELREKINWLNRQNVSVPQNYKHDDEKLSYLEKKDTAATTNTLQNHLYSQLYAFDLSQEELLIAKYLIACVDGKGYLDEDIYTTAQMLNADPAMVESIMALLRTFTPCGVCARNLQHCLELQLNTIPGSHLALAIVQNHMDAFAKYHYSDIAKKLKTTPAKVREAGELIRSLSPIPSAGFDSTEEVYYSFPDAYIISENDSLSVSLHKTYTPTIKIDQYYTQLYANTDSVELKKYLDTKLKSAHWLVKCISQRESTLLNCLRVICDLQKEYFTGTQKSLNPMTLADVAEQMNVHTSTVSRTIRGKNIYCVHGLLPIKSLFTQNISSDYLSACSSDHVKTMIMNIINEEDRSAPLSDQKISELLKTKGVSVSRRTVTKYRESMKIGSTLERKTI